MKKKMANIGQSGTPIKSKYKSPQSLGKAIKKVCSALPKSPGKQSIVIKEIVKKTFSADICKRLFKSDKKTSKEHETKQLVITFIVLIILAGKHLGREISNRIRMRPQEKEKKYLSDICL